VLIHIRVLSNDESSGAFEGLLSMIQAVTPVSLAIIYPGGASLTPGYLDSTLSLSLFQQNGSL